jgi:hypothetical protein
VVSNLGCSCRAVGKATSVGALPVAAAAAEIVTLTAMGLGVADGFARSTVRFKTAAHCACNQESMASAPVLSLNL